MLHRASADSRKLNAGWESGSGFRTMRHSGSSRRTDFDTASSRLFNPDVHAKAGLETVAAQRPVLEGDAFVLLVRLAAAWVTVANVVTTVETKHDSSLLSYSALDEHVEEGEQTFLLKRMNEGVAVEVVSTSRPRTPLLRLVPWMSRIFQQRTARRYVASWLVDS